MIALPVGAALPVYATVAFAAAHSISCAQLLAIAGTVLLFAFLMVQVVHLLPV